MYTLTLTHAERRAIDWIGHRYWHGDDFQKLLWTECTSDDSPDTEWDAPQAITFIIPEWVAWEINENLLSDSLACFAPELVEKLTDFIGKIV